MSTQGKFLLASPHLVESHFFRSVILMVKHTPEDAFGLIVNRPTVHDMRDVLETMDNIPCVHDDVIYQGGPVSGPLIAVHNELQQAGMEIIEGVYLSTCRDQVLELMNDASATVRFSNGYAGWGPFQLDEELEQGSWMVTDATFGEVFGCPEELWESLLYRVGRDVIASGMGSSRFPSDPTAN